MTKDEVHGDYIDQNTAKFAAARKKLEVIITQTTQIDVERRKSTLLSSVESVFFMSIEYFTNSNRCLDQGFLTSSATLSRCLLETSSDIVHVFRDPRKAKSRSRAYIKEVNTFIHLLKDNRMNFGEMEADRVLKNKGSWTTSTIEDRISFFGNGTLSMYDFMCHFTHAHPATILYNGEKNSDWLKNLILHVNVLQIYYVLLITLKVSRKDPDLYKQLEGIGQSTFNYANGRVLQFDY